MFSFGEIRAFTPPEVARMKSEIERVKLTIAKKEMDLIGVTTNPLNYILETQRDAMRRLESGVAQDKRILDQLQATLYSTIESGDTQKLANWITLAATVGSASDLAVWRGQVDYSRTAQTATVVAADTAKDVKKLGFGFGGLVAVAAGLFLAIKLTERR